ncbi:MAG TPA: SRPBCC domain-containing protein [Segetibacter sp.]
MTTTDVKFQPIKKSTEINASTQKVWHVLLDEEFTTKWYTAFGEDVHAETDWQLNSKATFTDGNGSGIVGKIVANEPCKIISIEYYGCIEKGKEDLVSENAIAMQGGRETYILSEKQGITNVAIEVDMPPQMCDMMSAAWDNALQKIKLLSEQN